MTEDNIENLLTCLDSIKGELRVQNILTIIKMTKITSAADLLVCPKDDTLFCCDEIRDYFRKVKGE